MNFHLSSWGRRIRGAALVAAFPLLSYADSPAPKTIARFFEKNCIECHDGETKKGGLDLTALPLQLGEKTNFTLWVKIHDRVETGEMPPPRRKVRPTARETNSFCRTLARILTDTEERQIAQEGRATQRRMNRYEYENALRDLLSAPWLQVRDALPEDGEANRFNKVGDALDISHVQMARYMNAAESALRQVMVSQAREPSKKPVKYYAREQRSFTGPMKFSEFNTAPERATFPVLGFQGQPDVRRGEASITAGSSNPEMREQEAVGVVASAYEPLEPKFSNFKAPASGQYRIRLKAWTVWVGPGSNKWFIPNLDDISKGRRPEPVTLYSETQPRLLRRLGSFDVTPEPCTHVLDVWLLAGETIRPDAGRLFRSRPGPRRWQNPLAEKEGQPGIAYAWLEVEGPLNDLWPPAGHRLLFGELPIKSTGFFRSTTSEIESPDPEKDSARLLRHFMEQAYRRPIREEEFQRFLGIVRNAREKGFKFMDSMIAGYTAVLCSPGFICIEEKPGRLDDWALAARLSFFLWNSPPDERLRNLARSGRLHQNPVLREETERLLEDPRSRRFVDAFLDYWINLRKIEATSPDMDLYPDYYLDDLLTESALLETQAFFAELIRGNLPASNIVDSDFAMLNERLADHYGLPPVPGVAIRRVPLPSGSPRGGLMTQCSVLKVTANGTLTSPVQRGAWIMERILGKPPPPPPPSVPAIEPDIRGAVTIRQQLDRHRTQESCSACHAKIDPAGFALESFDVMGGWRDRYRAMSGVGEPVEGIGKNGQRFEFRSGLPVDASGELPGAGKFHDIREFKKLALADEAQVARNLLQQLLIFATGSPIRFSDREKIEALLRDARKEHYPVRSLIHEIVQSDLFRRK